MWSMECHVTTCVLNQMDVVRWKDVLCISVCGILNRYITIATFVTVNKKVCVCVCVRACVCKRVLIVCEH